MPLPKTLLFYRFAPVADPTTVMLWQRDLCRGLKLRGRIIVSEHGINGTVGGALTPMKRYVRATRDYPAFKDIDFKWSDGTGLDAEGYSLDFPKLSVKVRPELVAFGAPEAVRVDAGGVVGGGIHLTPKQVNELVAERGEEVVFFDGRNEFEGRLGRFQGAIVPEVEYTREFLPMLERGELDHLKDRPVVTYCTGGIRCEVLSVHLRNRGFTEVYQLAGGIVRYAEEFRDRGLWQGPLYVFDGRVAVDYGSAGTPAETATESAALIPDAAGDHRATP